MRARQGYRGYIASRPVRGDRVAQHVQNLVVRDYARRNGLHFRLSATEYAMPACYMILDSVLDELDTLEGVICYSVFMLPERTERRRAVYERVLDRGCSLHGALENIAIRTRDDALRVEDIFAVAGLAGAAFEAIYELR